MLLAKTHIVPQPSGVFVLIHCLLFAVWPGLMLVLVAVLPVWLVQLPVLAAAVVAVLLSLFLLAESAVTGLAVVVVAQPAWRGTI